MWCNKCHGLTFAGNSSLGRCPAGGDHDHAGSVNYSISCDGTPVPKINQANWRWCNKCQWLTFAGNSPVLGPCPAGGEHNHTGSGDYVLLCNTVFGKDQQPNWRWCNKCQGLVFGGGSPAPCQAGGVHDLAESSDYILYSPGL